MPDSSGEARLGHELFDDELDKLGLEEGNAYRLAQFVDRLSRWMIRRGERKITPRIILRFQRIAIRGIYSCAGHFRNWAVKITGSSHKPPRDEIEWLVGAMCEIANERMESGEWDLIQVAAYLLWRLNWIHPFGGGNGRTSRALTYLAICVQLGEIPEGKLSIAEQIDGNRTRYQAALEDADLAWKEASVIGVSKMASLLDEFLKEQIKSADQIPAIDEASTSRTDF